MNDLMKRLFSNSIGLQVKYQNTRDALEDALHENHNLKAELSKQAELIANLEARVKCLTDSLDELGPPEHTEVCEECGRQHHVDNVSKIFGMAICLDCLDGRDHPYDDGPHPDFDTNEEASGYK